VKQRISPKKISTKNWRLIQAFTHWPQRTLYLLKKPRYLRTPHQTSRLAVPNKTPHTSYELLSYKY